MATYKAKYRPDRSFRTSYNDYGLFFISQDPTEGKAESIHRADFTQKDTNLKRRELRRL